MWLVEKIDFSRNFLRTFCTFLSYDSSVCTNFCEELKSDGFIPDFSEF